MSGAQAKQTASSLFAKTKTTIARTKQMALEKMGKAEETVDVSFNQERDRYREEKKAIKKLNKDTVRMLEILKELSVVQAEIAEDFYNLYESKAPMYNAALKNQDIAKANDTSRMQLDEQIKADFIDPVSKYLGQYKEIKTRLELHNTRRIDMDRYGRDVKGHQEKANAGKLSISEQKYETAKVNFTSLHDELMRDLPALFEDRLTFFNPVFATYLTGLAEHNKQVAKNTNEVLGLIANVNRADVHNHPRVITSVEDSAASFKGSSATNGSNGDTSRVRSNSSSTEEISPRNKAPTAPPKVVPIPPAKLQRAKAIFDFNAQESNELGFKVGDVITILAQKGDWWEGEMGGRKGLLPSNYVEIIK